MNRQGLVTGYHEARVPRPRGDEPQQLLSDAQSENLNLRKQVQSMTLRPDVGGIYARRLTAPSVRQALGVPNVSVNRGNGRLADPVVLLDGANGGIAIPDPRLDRASGVFVAGSLLQSSPGWSSAQTVEDNYGDLGSSVYGFGKLAADIKYTRSLAPGMTRGRPLSSRDWNLRSTSDTAPPDRSARIQSGRVSMRGIPVSDFNWGY